MNYLSLITLVFAFALTGCTSLHKSQSNGPIDVGVKSNLHADIEVDMSRPVKGAAHHTQLLWFIPVKNSHRYADGVTYNGNESGGFLSGLFGPSFVDQTKSAAAYNAVVPNKVDVLVAPQYLVKEKSYVFGIWKEVTVSVTGYSGKVRSIKSVPVK